MLRKAVVSILLSLFSIVQIAQAQPELITIPFRAANQTLLVLGKVNGKAGYLMIDTGISNMLIDQADAQGSGSFATKDYDGLRSVTGAESNAGMSLVLLEIGDFSVKTGATIVDLRPIERQKNVNLLGVVGIDLFRKYEIEIDPFAQELRLYRLDNQGVRRALEPQAIPSATLPFRSQGHLLCITAELNGLPLQLGLDTGAELNLFAQEIYENAPRQFSGKRPQQVAGLNGVQTAAFSAQLTGLEIGGLEAPASGALIVPMNTQYGGLDGKNVHGLLGYPFFRQFRTAINFKKREVYLWDRRTAEQAPVVRN